MSNPWFEFDMKWNLPPAANAEKPIFLLSSIWRSGFYGIGTHASSLIVFDSFVVHGSMSNHSDKPRKTVIARLFSGKDRKEDIYAPNENLVLRGWNHRMTRDTALKVPAKRAKEKTKEPVAAKGGQSDSD